MTRPGTYAVYRTIIAVRFDPHFPLMDRNDIQRHHRDLLVGLMRDSLHEAGLSSEYPDLEDSGHGMLVLLPADVPKPVVAQRWLPTLSRRLGEYNAGRSPAATLRLRVALHAGAVDYDSRGRSGAAVDHASRLLASGAAESAARANPERLGVVVSGQFFDEAIRDTPGAAAYRRIRTETRDVPAIAWLRVGGAPPDREVPRRADFAVLYDPKDAEWAEWIAAQVRWAGYSAVLDARALQPSARPEAVADRADRIVVVVSPAVYRTRAFTDFRSHPGAIAVQVAEGAPAEPFRLACSLVGLDRRAARDRLLTALGIAGGARDEPGFPGDPDRTTPVVHDEPLGPVLTVVYAAPDEQFADDLAKSLAGLVAERVLSSVAARRVAAATIALETRVAPEVRDADLVLLVVSRDLLAVEYGAARELRVIMDRHHRKAAVVLPVVFRPTSWQEQPFGSLEPLPTGGRPVVDWHSRDEALLSVVEGVRFAARQVRGEPPMPVPPTTVAQPRSLGEVFTVAGVPTVTFVEPDDFAEFRMSLRQPGLGIVIEGPSGIGKTTLLRNAVALDEDRLGEVTVLSARNPADLPAITALPEQHTGLVAVDDFQRLPADLQNGLADYLKLLADSGSDQRRLVLLGIPGTARHLVSVGTDVATRIRVFRLGAAVEGLIIRMIEQGENALNIAFDRKAEISRAAAGSLLTAQMLCWQIAVTAGVEQTEPKRRVVRTELAHARAKVTDRLKLKYHDVVVDFITRDRPDEAVCVDLLLELARTPAGILKLDGQRAELFEGLRDDHLFHDPRGHRLVADDPQFRFYLGQLHRDDLLDLAGKRLPVPRDQVFVCYSHQDAHWLGRLQVHLKPLRLDVWSDRRIELGDQWQKEITQALDRAKAALVLVSADSLASDYINSEELPRLLAAAEDGGCRIIPLLVGPSLFHATPALSRFQGVPANTTLTELPPHDGERVLADLAARLSALFG